MNVFSTARVLLALFTLSAAGAIRLAHGAPDQPAILCIGDSLTYGVGGNGTNWPAVVASETRRPTVNQGFPSWTPRHLLYYVLLHDVPAVSVEQLRSIPPAAYEERRHQPTIDHLRTFLKEGQRVRVTTGGGAAPVEYVWRAAATRDDASTLKPDAVGDPAHRPLIATGRWVRASGPARGRLPTPPSYVGVIVWVGANGMDADEVDASVRAMRASLGDPEHFLVLGLINRADPAKDPASVAAWAKWIGECNARLAARYPDHFLDLQAWATATGSYATGGYRGTNLTAAEDSADAEARRLGVLPETLRAPDNRTHLNARGYTLIGLLVSRWVRDHGW